MGVDSFLFRLINQLPHPAVLDAVSLVFDFMGRFLVLLTLGALLFFYGWFVHKKEICRQSLRFLFFLVSIAAVVMLLKWMVNRPRPYRVLADVYMIGRGEGSSFPSEFAAYTMMTGYFMHLLRTQDKNGLWLLFILTAAFCRVYQGMNFPLDILAGWVVALTLMRLLGQFDFINLVKRI